MSVSKISGSYRLRWSAIAVTALLTAAFLCFLLAGLADQLFFTGGASNAGFLISVCSYRYLGLAAHLSQSHHPYGSRL